MSPPKVPIKCTGTVIWVIAIGGDGTADAKGTVYSGIYENNKIGTVTIGDTGRDWIWNTSEGGIIYGDTIDGLDPVSHQSIHNLVKASAFDTSKTSAWHSYSDSIWWSGDTTVMDADHNDHLKFFGLPLLGGDTSGGLAFSVFGGVAAGLVGTAVGAAQADKSAVDSFYFDNLLPFINYKMDFTHGRHDLLVINLFSELFNFAFATFTGSVPEFPAGFMRIKNFDFVGSYTGIQQVELTKSKNYDDHGTFDMLFKKANPIWAVLALLPDTAITSALTGGGNAFGPLIDTVLTGASANDNFETQALKEAA